MQREIAPASSRSVEASIKDKPSEKDLRFFNFGPSSNHCSVTGAGLKAREINLFLNEVLRLDYSLSMNHTYIIF